MGQTGQTYLTFKLDSPGKLCRAAFAIHAMFYTWFGVDSLLNLGRERAAQQLIVCRHNWGQRRSWQEKRNQNSAKDHKQGGTQDVRVDSEQRAPILKSMMKISNKLKTAAKVFDVFLKENEVKFGIWKFDMWHFKSLQWEEKLPRLVIPSRFVAIFKHS